MSDSDDTDILLLIPPDFFLTEQSIDDSLSYELFQSTLQGSAMRPIATTANSGNLTNKYMYGMDSHCSEHCTTSPPKNLSDQFKYKRYSAPSSILSDPHASHYSNRCSDPTSSTPYRASAPILIESTPKKNDGKVLQEIDSFLDKCSLNQNRSSPYRKTYDSQTKIDAAGIHTSDFNTPQQYRSEKVEPKSLEKEIVTNLSATKMSEWNSGLKNHDEQLINLAKIWELSEKKNLSSDSAELEEERLRRRQCERSIQNLQQQLQQYQSKYSDAIKLDQTKNEAMARLHSTNSNLIANINELERQLSELEIKRHRDKECLQNENRELKQRNQQLHLQNAELERKTNSLLRSTNEVREIHHKQMEDMEIRLSNAKENEAIFINEMSSLKNQFIMKTAEFEKEQSRTTELEQKLQFLQSTVDELQAKEKKFLEEMESQRIALKSFYQTQLDDLVRTKVEEYQKQLDSVEDCIRKETKQNERAIAERAIKQIELINQKNEQEFSLLEEKHREEMELFKIRLVNATKTIVELEEELSVYRAKRSDIAERLHNVIETQWKKTLEIITNSEQATNANGMHNLSNNLARNINDLENYTENELARHDSYSKNESFLTPNPNKLRKHINLNMD